MAASKELRKIVAGGDGHYCQVCGKRPAQTPANKAYTVCSDGCSQEFEQMYLAVAFQGKMLIGAPAGLADRMRAPRTWKYCKHCQAKMEMLEKECQACRGAHSM